MSEEYYVVREREFRYDGYFSVAELYYILEDILNKLGYDKVEKRHDVRVFKTHREIELELAPDIHVSDYIKHVIEIKLYFRDLVDVELNDKEISKPIQYGKIRAKFSAAQITNSEEQWSSSAWGYLIRVFIDKFIYPNYLGDTKEQLKGHVELIINELSAYLNMNRFKYSNQSAFTVDGKPFPFSKPDKHH